MTVVVKGYRELQAAFRVADEQSRKGLRVGLREVAEPIRRDAELHAQSSIPRIGARWFKMRTGVTSRLVYVAPRQRGVRRADDPKRRPNLAKLLAERAMEPSLRAHETQVERGVEDLFDHIAVGFNRPTGGAL